MVFRLQESCVFLQAVEKPLQACPFRIAVASSPTSGSGVLVEQPTSPTSTIESHLLVFIALVLLARPESDGNRWNAMALREQRGIVLLIPALLQLPPETPNECPFTDGNTHVRPGYAQQQGGKPFFLTVGQFRLSAYQSTHTKGVRFFG